MELVKQFMSRNLISAEFPDLHPPDPHQESPLGCAGGAVGTAGDPSGAGQPDSSWDRAGVLHKDAGGVQQKGKANSKLMKDSARSCLLMVTEKTPPANFRSNSSALCPCWISHWHLQTIPAPLPCNFNYTVLAHLFVLLSCSVAACGSWHP